MWSAAYSTSGKLRKFLEGSSEVARWRRFEAALCVGHENEERFAVAGFCLACDLPVSFAVDRQFGSILLPGGGWRPNWRERLVCPACGLNNRQRAIAVAAREIVARPGDAAARSLYVTEQVGPLYDWLARGLGHAEVVGSEYLSDRASLPAELRSRLRHQDLERLDFEDRSFDAIVCNDVLEHVNDPNRCIEEIARVLRPGGEALITVPLSIAEERTVRRAETRNGEPYHLLPPQYHGDPVSQAGALVFHDFGWDLLDRLRAGGFSSVGLVLYWSYLYGHLGVPQFYLRARVGS